MSFGTSVFRQIELMPFGTSVFRRIKEQQKPLSGWIFFQINLSMKHRTGPCGF